MKFAALFALSLIAVQARAEITVTKVKGNKAVVEVSGGKLKEGDKLQAYDEVSDIEGGASSGAAKTGLRKRQHRMSWRYGSASTKTEIKIGSTTTTTDATSGSLSYTYEYNFSRFAFGVGVQSEVSKSSSTESSTTNLVLLGRLNFIEDTPGNDFVPWAGLAAGSHSEKYTGTSSFDVTGSAAQLSLGLDWYPFSELFAFQAYLFGNSIKGTVSGAVSGDAAVTSSGVTVGWALVF